MHLFIYCLFILAAKAISRLQVQPLSSKTPHGQRGYGCPRRAQGGCSDFSHCREVSRLASHVTWDRPYPWPQLQPRPLAGPPCRVGRRHRPPDCSWEAARGHLFSPENHQGIELLYLLSLESNQTKALCWAPKERWEEPGWGRLSLWQQQPWHLITCLPCLISDLITRGL